MVGSTRLPTISAGTVLHLAPMQMSSFAGNNTYQAYTGLRSYVSFNLRRSDLDAQAIKSRLLSLFVCVCVCVCIDISITQF